MVENWMSRYRANHVTKKLEATCAGGLGLDVLKGISAPHTGQSSQLFLDADDGSAQFLAAVARSTLNLPLTQIAKPSRPAHHKCSM